MKKLIFLIVVLLVLVPAAYASTATYKLNASYSTAAAGNRAWAFLCTSKPCATTPKTASGEFNQGNYTATHNSDDSYASLIFSSDIEGGRYEVMEYQINITQTVSSITSINITWEGYTNLWTYDAYSVHQPGHSIYLYNFSSGGAGWVLVYSTSSTFDDTGQISLTGNLIKNFVNASNGSVLWVQVESITAGSPHIYAFNGTNHIFIADAVPLAFMPSLERTTYAEIKKEYLSKINGKYILRVTDPFPNEDSFINDVKLYGIKGNAERFLPSTDGKIHGIEKLESPIKKEGNKFLFLNPNKKQAKIVVEARMTNNPVLAVRFFFSKLGGNNYNFYNTVLSLPFINSLWNSAVEEQSGIKVYANGKLVDILELKGNTMHDAGFDDAVFLSDYEQRVVYADVDYEELIVELKYPETFYVVKNVTVDYSNDAEYEIKELDGTFKPFVTSRGNYRDIYFDADDDYDSFVVSLKGWYRPDWALENKVSLIQSLSHFSEVIKAILFGENYILNHLKDFHNTMFTDYFAVNITYLMPIDFVAPTDDDGALLTRNHTYINVTNNTGISSMFIDFNRSLIGYWNLNNNTLDNSTYGNNGTFINGNGTNCAASVSGKYGTGCEFNGTNQYINVSRSPSLNITDAITVEAWIKTSLNGGTGAGEKLAFVRRNFAWALELKTTDVADFLLWNETGSLVVLTSTTTLTANQWYHIAGTYDSSTGVMEFYVNGNKEATGTHKGRIFTNNTDLITISSNNGTEVFFNGTIDEVRIWNRALSEQEINASFNAKSYRLERNFTDLVRGNYEYYAAVTDVAGNYNRTETRTVTVINNFSITISDIVESTDTTQRILITGRKPDDTSLLTDADAKIQSPNRPVTDFFLSFDAIQRLLLTSRSVDDKLTLIDSISKILNAGRQTDDTISLIDIISRLIIGNRETIDSLSLTDTTSRLF